jgi:hypothetical protein
VLGLRGSVINEIRSQTGASIKIEDNAGEAGVSVALRDDQLVKVQGSYDSVRRACERISERIRTIPHAELAAAHERIKRSRMGPGAGPGGGLPPPFDRHGPPPQQLPPPQRFGGPPGGGPPGNPYGQQQQQQQDPFARNGGPGGGPPNGAGPPSSGGSDGIMAILPPAALSAFADNPSVDTRGLEGLATVEYRLLVPIKKSGIIIGERGSVSELFWTAGGGRHSSCGQEDLAAQSGFLV